MKYMRKTPVEAIQWNGDNMNEVANFISPTKSCYTAYDSPGDLNIVWGDLSGRTLTAVLPKFGWIVREGKTFHFYKNITFHGTFEKVPDDDSKGVDWEGINKTIEDVFDSFDKAFIGFNDVFGAEPNKETSDVNRMRAQINPDGRLTKLIDDLYKDDEKTREEIKKNMSEGLKEMAGSDTHKATFESVLAELQKLHSAKNHDYGNSFTDLFKECGMIYAYGHLKEKLNRIKGIMDSEAQVKGEKLEDSLKDLASYAIMTLVELRSKDNGTD